MKNHKCGWSRVSVGKPGCKVKFLNATWTFQDWWYDLRWLIEVGYSRLWGQRDRRHVWRSSGSSCCLVTSSSRVDEVVSVGRKDGAVHADNVVRLSEFTIYNHNQRRIRTDVKYQDVTRVLRLMTARYQRRHSRSDTQPSTSLHPLHTPDNDSNNNIPSTAIFQHEWVSE